MLRRGEFLQNAYETGARNSSALHNVSETVQPLQEFIDKFKNAPVEELRSEAAGARDIMNRFFKPSLPEGVQGPVPQELKMSTGELLDLKNSMSAWIKDAQTPQSLETKGALYKQARNKMMGKIGRASCRERV